MFTGAVQRLQVAQLSQKDSIAGCIKLWQKYKCEKRASNIALYYGIDVDKGSFYYFTSPCL